MARIQGLRIKGFVNFMLEVLFTLLRLEALAAQKCRWKPAEGLAPLKQGDCVPIEGIRVNSESSHISRQAKKKKAATYLRPLVLKGF